MDTITHGIAGALIGKAVFRGEDMFARGPVTRGRIITWALMLGAIFPDSDTFRDIFSSDPMLMITWHRSITHSLVCLPVFALGLAALTRAFARWRKWDAPPFGLLTAIYAVGILSHIVLDLATSFGTMIWSPLRWSRPAWDLLFIVDFSFTAILLAPQFLAWVYARRAGLARRAFAAWFVAVAAALGVAAIARTVDAPITRLGIVGALALVTALFLLPAIGGWGTRVRHRSWNLAGLAAACGYIAFAAFAHHIAIARTTRAAAALHLDVQSLAALPAPPTPWHWDGLIRAPRGVYEMRLDLSKADSPANPQSADPSDSTSDAMPIEYSYFPDAAPNEFIERAKTLRRVQEVLWFDRFPVIRFHKEGDEAVVEIVDVRFASVRQGRASAFTYEVRFDLAGRVLSQGWLTR